VFHIKEKEESLTGRVKLMDKPREKPFWEKKIKVEKNEREELKAVLLSVFNDGLESRSLPQLYLSTKPSGAELRINDKNLGKTPVEMFLPFPGSYRIDLEKPHYFPDSRELSVDFSNIYELDIKLRPDYYPAKPFAWISGTFLLAGAGAHIWRFYAKEEYEGAESDFDPKFNQWVYAHYSTVTGYAISLCSAMLSLWLHNKNLNLFKPETP
jgi:hypothetical protein